MPKTRSPQRMGAARCFGKVDGMPPGGNDVLMFELLYKTTVHGNQNNEALQYLSDSFLSR
jgi:hypothetical protein